MNLTLLFNWLVRSSEDPTRWSKTIKGIGTGTIAILAILNLDTSGFSDVFKYLTTFVETFLALIAAWATLTGAVRKVKLTRLGTNRVLNDRIWE